MHENESFVQISVSDIQSSAESAQIPVLALQPPGKIWQKKTGFRPVFFASGAVTPS
jgi:hypothetical protein